ncbi:HSP20-like chaperone [Xylaria flabelliformis]|nr:HSP20-like chaperone [Xylaria flabelliformis]KAI0856196.1 HSP20-like chaperone [Xylaria cubensis]
MENSNRNQNNNDPAAPFWDFLRSFDTNRQAWPGYGVDNMGSGSHDRFFDAAGSAPSFGFGAWPPSWGRHMMGGHHRWGDNAGHHHHGRRDDSGDKESNTEETDASSDTCGGHPTPPPPPAQDPFQPPPPPHGHHPRGPPPPFGPPRGRGGRCGRGGRRHRPPHPGRDGLADLRALLSALPTTLFTQSRSFADQYRAGAASATPNQDGVFVPPVDIFSAEKAYILHVTLPGAAKEDINVSWDGDKVNITGVVHRPGNGELLGALVSSERKVGMFERSIKLPPPGSSENEDVDGYGITAKMENGILIVTVPKVEKDWTEVHKVEIE